jgi:glycosyltransferase involved in cell wall biosynthesis
MKNSIGTPTVSVILPTYNPGISIRDAVQSILCQKVGLELIVVDDGSSVDVSALIGPDVKKVKMIRQANKGVSAARNSGVREAQGFYLSFLDDDDTWTPTALKERIKCIEDYPGAAGVISVPISYNSSGQLSPRIEIGDLEIGQSKILQRWEYCRLQQKMGYFLIQGSLIRRDIFHKVGGFDEELFSSEDQDLLFSIIHEYPLIFMQVPTFIRFQSKMTANPDNYSKLKNSQYRMLNKQVENVNKKWSTSDAKVFWAFKDMAVRQCLKIALKNNDYKNAYRYSKELKKPFEFKNIVLKILVYLSSIRLF